MAGAAVNKRVKLKVVLLGEGRVGKTSILVRFCKNEYDGRQPPTLNASYIDKKLNVGDQPIQLSIWDTAGQERFHALGPIYYRDADAALLVYDITDAESFHKVQKWVKELRQVVGDKIVIAIAGNKLDLEKNRHVKEEEALRYSQSVQASHFYTSAKLNKGLEEVFVHLAKEVVETMKISASIPTNTEGNDLDQRGNGPGRLVIVDDTVTDAHQKEDSCC